MYSIYEFSSIIFGGKKKVAILKFISSLRKDACTHQCTAIHELALVRDIFQHVFILNIKIEYKYVREGLLVAAAILHGYKSSYSNLHSGIFNLGA